MLAETPRPISIFKSFDASAAAFLAEIDDLDSLNSPVLTLPAARPRAVIASHGALSDPKLP